MVKLIVTLLAGGLGKRMQSPLPKVLHKVGGIPMIVRLLEEVEKLNPYKIFVVAGQYKDIIEKTINQYILNDLQVNYIIQQKPLGTGHAVFCTLSELEDHTVNLILNGDNPMLTTELLENLIDNFIIEKRDIQIAAIELGDPTGFGRIIMNKNNFEKIVEEKDCDDAQKQIQLINCGIYIATSELLKEYIPLIQNNNAQHEYYLTDIVEICQINKIVIGLHILDSSQELYVTGINTKEQLDALNNQLMQI